VCVCVWRGLFFQYNTETNLRETRTKTGPRCYYYYYCYYYYSWYGSRKLYSSLAAALRAAVAVAAVRWAGAAAAVAGAAVAVVVVAVLSMMHRHAPHYTRVGWFGTGLIIKPTTTHPLHPASRDGAVCRTGMTAI